MHKPLGRRTPTDFEHVTRWPLTATTTPAKPVPVAIGVNWYSAFDTPEKDNRGRWWIGRGDLGSVRGGHCVCLEPGAGNERDTPGWYGFYDQGREGACVGFGCSRMMSLLNRKRYDARWLWDRAKEVDEWPDTNPGDDNGTSVRAALDVLRTRGHVVYKPTTRTARASRRASARTGGRPAPTRSSRRCSPRSAPGSARCAS
jgi:hypothetical protein